MTKNNRFFTGLLTMVVLFALLSSTAFIAAKSDHHCHEEECTVCHHISTCENILQLLGLAMVVIGLGVVLSYMLCRLIRYCTVSVSAATLVSLKVELLN